MTRWPGLEEVDSAVRAWAAEKAARRAEVVRIGYIGSYARGDWGVGSDVDLLVLVSHSERPFSERASEWDTADLPVPADVWVYTVGEWRSMATEGCRFRRDAEAVAVWVFESAGCSRAGSAAATERKAESPRR